MPYQSPNLGKILHIPNINLIVGKPMTTNNFIFSLGKQNRANLTASLFFSNHLFFTHIPKPDTPVGSPCPSGYKVRLGGIPGKGLYGSLVGFLQNWNLSFWGVNKKFIVVSSRGKIFQVWRPLQAAYLLGMAGVFSLGFLGPRAS